MVNGKGKQIAHLENIFLWGFGTAAGGAESWQGQDLRVALPPRAIFFPSISHYAFFHFEPGIRNIFSRLATPTILFLLGEEKKKKKDLLTQLPSKPSLPFSAKCQVKIQPL